MSRVKNVITVFIDDVYCVQPLCPKSYEHAHSHAEFSLRSLRNIAIHLLEQSITRSEFATREVLHHSGFFIGFYSHLMAIL